MRQRWLRGCVLAVALTLASQSLAQQNGANLTPGKTPVLITADQLTYDRDLGVIVASGHLFPRLAELAGFLLAGTRADDRLLCICKDACDHYRAGAGKIIKWWIRAQAD